MNLAPDGREFANWIVTGADEDTTLEVTFNDGTTWHPLERTGTSARVLVAGPTATGNPGGTVVLAVGRNTARIRATDNPEVVVRRGGAIDVG